MNNIMFLLFRRAQENFAWNVRLLKAQLGLMQSTCADARQTLAQAAESARVLGLLAGPSPPGSIHEQTVVV